MAPRPRATTLVGDEHVSDVIARGLTDYAVLGAIFRDVIKVDAPTGPAPVRGSRPMPEMLPGITRLNDFLGDRYQMEPFDIAFLRLKGRHSIRRVAEVTSLSRFKVHGLLRGELQPTTNEMRAIAEAYGRRPEWFVEYRSALVAAIVAARLDTDPERSATIVAKLKLAQ